MDSSVHCYVAHLGDAATRNDFTIMKSCMLKGYSHRFTAATLND